MVPPWFHGCVRRNVNSCYDAWLRHWQRRNRLKPISGWRGDVLYVFSCFFFSGCLLFLTSQRSWIVGNAWSSAVEIVKATEGHDAWKATFWGGNFFELSDGIVPSDRMRTENCEAMISGLTTVSYKKCSIFLEGVVDRIVVLRFNYLVYPSIYPTENR